MTAPMWVGIGVLLVMAIATAIFVRMGGDRE